MIGFGEHLTKYKEHRPNKLRLGSKNGFAQTFILTIQRNYLCTEIHFFFLLMQKIQNQGVYQSFLLVALFFRFSYQIYVRFVVYFHIRFMSGLRSIFILFWQISSITSVKSRPKTIRCGEQARDHMFIISTLLSIQHLVTFWIESKVQGL